MTTDNKFAFLNWKVIFSIFCLIFFGLYLYNKKTGLKLRHNSIIQFSIAGPITDNSDLIDKLETLRKNQKVRGLIVEINSPGGGVVPSFLLYESLKKFSEEKKPVVIVMKSLAASGGYLISLAGDHIIAHPTTITGSIGVIFMQPDIRELMNKIGIKPVVFKTGKLKASPNPSEDISEEARLMINKIAEGTKKEFLNLVIQRRNLRDEKVISDISNSGIYLGIDAKKIGLIDELGSIDQAITWLKANSFDFPIEHIDMYDNDKSSILKKIFGSKTYNDTIGSLAYATNKIASHLSMSGLYLWYGI